MTPNLSKRNEQAFADSFLMKRGTDSFGFFNSFARYSQLCKFKAVLSS